MKRILMFTLDRVARSTLRQAGAHRVAALLLTSAGMAAVVAGGPLVSSASAASPSITITCPTSHSCTASGVGFTPSGHVAVRGVAGTTTFSGPDVVASAGTLVCIEGGIKPVCHVVGGGTFSAPLPTDYGLGCNATAGGTVTYTDRTTGAAASQPVTWVGPCLTPTTTTLSLPATVDTEWEGSSNPAQVTAGNTTVTSGTVSITVTLNGTVVKSCTYPAGATTGCILANLPAGNDQVQAVYSGSAQPPFEMSSASATIDVIQAEASGSTTSTTEAGYLATGETYTAVSANWTVPKADCGNLLSGNLDLASGSATWIGIDGFDGITAEQIGTTSNCLPTGEGYWAFDQSTTKISNPISPGDFMRATIRSTGPGAFTMTLADTTAPDIWTATVPVSNPASTGASAECMVGDPVILGNPISLTNFGSVNFDSCLLTGSNGLVTPLRDHANTAVNMVSGTTTKATASPLGPNGSSFTVTWLHS